MESGLISDKFLSTSSAWNNKYFLYGAQRARVNLNTWPEGWNAVKNDPNPWLQIQFEQEKIVTAVATQGFGNTNANEWVKTYFLAVSSDGEQWQTYSDKNKEKVGTIFFIFF